VMMIINVSIAQHVNDSKEVLIAAYGMIGRINIFMILPLIAISQAVQTIIAHNYGANRLERVHKTAIAGLLISTSYLSVMTSILYLWPEQIFSLFSDDGHLIESAMTIANVMFSALPLVGLSIVSTAYFQAIGKAKVAMLISSVKVYLLLIPIIFWLTTQFEINVVWYAFPITECISFLLLLLFTSFYVSKERIVDHNINMTVEKTS